MRIGAIADIHGNRPALEAVLADMPSVDRLICAGDIVGYNPWPAACVKYCRNRDIASVQGNHDRAVVTGRTHGLNTMATAGVEYARDHLTDEQCGWLAGLPETRTIADGQIRIAHGHPTDPDRYVWPHQVTADILGDERWLVLGHTHQQFVKAVDGGTVLNPGSVGQPRDGDPRAGYAIIDLTRESVDTHRVDYDIDAVREKVSAVGLPSTIGDRLVRGR